MSNKQAFPFKKWPRGFLIRIKQYWRRPRTRKKLIMGSGVIAILIGAYIFALVGTPFIYYFLKGNTPIAAIVATTFEEDATTLKDPMPEENRLVIPSLSLDLEIFEGGESSLEKGIWHRLPENGNPVEGGNFILTGHRFNIGLTPVGTLRKSPLYNIHKLEKGDAIKIYWEKQVYEYEILEIYEVNPYAVEIEEQTDEATLTLYTCTFGGKSDGRVVVRARLVESPEDD